MRDIVNSTICFEAGCCQPPTANLLLETARKLHDRLQVIAAGLILAPHFPGHTIYYLLYLLFGGNIRATRLRVVKLPFVDDCYVGEVAFDGIEQWCIFAHAAPLVKFFLMPADDKLRHGYFGFTLFQGFVLQFG